MLRVPSEVLSRDWSNFIVSLIGDLKPLGYFAQSDDDGSVTIGTWLPPDPRYRCAHDVRHRALLKQNEADIRAFERDFADCFVDKDAFQPSSVRPALEIVDFKDPRHLRIIGYLKLYQSVTSRKAVGRRMGLLIWDIGQSDTPKLFGAAILSSARFSQRIRDRRLGWQPDFPKTSPRHDSAARGIRVAGLNRIMQLSMACALPPYSFLSGAWLAAMAPFTDVGLDAFRKSLKKPDSDADLIAVITTTGMDISGTPFRGHRVAQIAPKGVAAVPGASGNLYSRVEPAEGSASLRASFRDLLSQKVWDQARDLFREARPDRFSTLRSPYPSAMAYALRRFKLRKALFEGNEMGVHLGALGTNSLSYLQSGKARPRNERPLLDWNQVVEVWSRRFLPAPATVGESTEEKFKAEHREARQRRLEAARIFPADQIKLSYLLDADDPPRRLRLIDLAPLRK